MANGFMFDLWLGPLGPKIFPYSLSVSFILEPDLILLLIKVSSVIFIYERNRGNISCWCPQWVIFAIKRVQVSSRIISSGYVWRFCLGNSVSSTLLLFVQYFWKWKTTSFFSNGRRPQFLVCNLILTQQDEIWKTTSIF